MKQKRSIIRAAFFKNVGLRNARAVLLFMAFIVLGSSGAQACINPAGIAGEIIYNGPNNVPAYCDSTNWIAMAGAYSQTVGAYAPNAVYFDGTNDYLTATISNPYPTLITGAFWFKRDLASLGTSQVILSYRGSGVEYFRIRFTTANTLVFDGRPTNVDPLNILLQSTNAITNAAWHHVFFSIDSTDRSRDILFIDDVDVKQSGAVTWAAFGMDQDVEIGSENNGSLKLRANLSSVWIDIGRHIDFTDVNNRRKFINANKNPVYLGSDGAVPTGQAPSLFFSGDTASWHTNKGADGGFTLHGALTTSTTVPFKCTPGVIPPASASCGGKTSERLVFITSTTMQGNIGGAAGADAICQARAAAGGLDGRYSAWLSDGITGTAPIARFEKPTVPYRRLDGNAIANGWNDLVDGTIAYPLNIDEFGAIAAPNYVYTNTSTNGGNNSGVNHCTNFTVAAGTTTGPDNNAVTWGSGAGLSCNTNRHLYCFEQYAIASRVTQTVPSGMVGYWRLDEASGATAAYDQITKTYGNLEGGAVVASTTGIIDGAYTINADYQVTAGSNNTYVLDNNWSISVWMKATRTASDKHILMKNSHPERNYVLVVLSTGQVRVGYDNVSGVFAGKQSNLSYDDDKWHHVVGTFDDVTNALSLYIDGVLVPQSNSGGGAGTEPAAPLGGVLRLFSNAGTFGRFSGAVDELRLYNRVITPAEIGQLYNAASGIRYNANERVLEYFDGDKYVSMTKPWPEVGRAAAPNCQNIGQPCNDGTIYVGLSPDGNVPMFTTLASAPGGANYPWNNGNGSGRVVVMPDACYSSGQPGCITGQLNTTTGAAADSDSGVAGIQPHQAINYCNSLNVNGHDDWYLPAQEELRVLYTNRAVGSLSGSFGTGANAEHWTSSEINNTSSNFFDFGGSGGNNSSKENSLSVRCVRKGSFEVGDTGGLIGHWKLDETTGTVAADSSGNGRNATMVGSLNAANHSKIGAKGRALNFDGSDDMIHTPDFTGAETAISMSAWVRADAWSGPFRYIAGQSKHTNSDGVFGLNYGFGSNTITWTVRNAANSNVVASFTPPAAGIWFHVTGTYDGANVRVYLNGVLQSTVAQTGALFNSNAAFTIGRKSDSGIYPAGGSAYTFDGDIDDVRVYNRALSTQEAVALYKMGVPVGQVTSLPQGCPNIRDTCDDGTIYAGLMGADPAYLAPGRVSGNARWKTTAGIDDISVDSSSDGRINHANRLGNLSDFPAFQLCENLSITDPVLASGATDWYLPAVNELLTLKSRVPSIVDGATGWSSTESNTTLARGVSANSFDVGKTSSTVDVWCIRRGPLPRCINPYGKEGDVVYNQTHGVVQYCNGAHWIAVGK